VDGVALVSSSEPSHRAREVHLKRSFAAALLAAACAGCAATSPAPPPPPVAATPAATTPIAEI